MCVFSDETEHLRAARRLKPLLIIALYAGPATFPARRGRGGTDAASLCMPGAWPRSNYSDAHFMMDGCPRDMGWWHRWMELQRNHTGYRDDTGEAAWLAACDRCPVRFRARTRRANPPTPFAGLVVCLSACVGRNHHEVLGPTQGWQSNQGPSSA